MFDFDQNLLLNIRRRASSYDQKNEFFAEDFADLKAAGYLTAAVPSEFGGPGLSLTELSRSQRVLAKHSPATALGVNMHLLWGAVAAYLSARGDERLNWIFSEMLAGETFAFGVSETKNPYVLLDSNCSAVSSGSDYLISGKKIFTTLSPVWTRLGIHAKTTGENPEIIVGFIRRAGFPGDGISYPDKWNPLGMRATQSLNTELNDALLKAEDITARFAPFEVSDQLIMAVSLCFGVLTSSIYAGISDRALELATEALDPADALTATWLSDGVADHLSALDSLERLAGDVDRQEAREDYSTAVAAMKTRVTDEARAAVDIAFRIVGSRAFDADSELSRIYRDVVAGIFHPRSAKSLAAAIRASFEA